MCGAAVHIVIDRVVLSLLIILMIFVERFGSNEINLKSSKQPSV